MRLFVNELGRFDHLLDILKNLLRFVKYFKKKFSLGIYAPKVENPQLTEKGRLCVINSRDESDIYDGLTYVLLSSRCFVPKTPILPPGIEPR